MGDLKLTTGAINFTNYLHVTAAKVSAPTQVVWETWIGAPVPQNYNFIIPVLDSDNYYISFYDAATNTALGLLAMQMFADGKTLSVITERIFYTCGGSGAHDPADSSTSITDPYLINKNVTGVFKEGFRFYKPAEEYTSDPLTGILVITNGTSFSLNEKMSVDITYVVPDSGSSSGSGFYRGNLNVPESTRTLVAGDIDKRIRCIGTAPTQVITLCTLASISVDTGFYFDNACGGTAIQVKILLAGADRIKYNGFMATSDLFAEFWVSKGEHLLLRKYDANYWEVFLDYKGTNVGEKLTLGYKNHPGILVEYGQLIDGDEFGRLWWWLNNVLPATHKYITDTVTGFFIADPQRLGQFALHSSLKKFRMPYTVGLSEKGLTDFTFYGLDTANRPVDYPGGFQDQMLLIHGHKLWADNGGGSGGVPFALNRTDGISVTGAKRGGGYLTSNGNANKLLEEIGGPEQRLKNTGVIYARRI